MSFNPQGSKIITASSDKTCRIWSTDGECLQTLEGHIDEIFSCAFNYEGDTIITGARRRLNRPLSVADRLASAHLHGSRRAKSCAGQKSPHPPPSPPRE